MDRRVLALVDVMLWLVGLSPSEPQVPLCQVFGTKVKIRQEKRMCGGPVLNVLSSDSCLMHTSPATTRV